MVTNISIWKHSCSRCKDTKNYVHVCRMFASTHISGQHQIQSKRRKTNVFVTDDDYFVQDRLINKSNQIYLEKNLRNKLPGHWFLHRCKKDKYEY